MAEPKLYVVILAGGSGERLFPLSTPDKPKQFLRLFGDSSLLQETVFRARLLPYTTITVCSIRKYEETIFDHVGDLDVAISIEGKEAIGTAPAIESVLDNFQANQYCSSGDVFLFCPCDHVIENKGNFAMGVQKAIEQIVGTDKLMLFGVPMRYKDSRLGHFLATYNNEVIKFFEKPTSSEIDYLLSHNLKTYWNTGIFLGTFEAFQKQFYLNERKPIGSFDTFCLARRSIPLGSILARNADSWGWDDIGNWESLIRHIVTARR